MRQTDDRRTKQVIVMRKDLNMRKGKMIAQGAHASIAWLTSKLYDQSLVMGLEALSEAEWDWIDSSFVKICVGVDSEDELLAVVAKAQGSGVQWHLIKDAGFTEFGGVPTTTCCAVGPDWNEKIDAITGELKLL